MCFFLGIGLGSFLSGLCLVWVIFCIVLELMFFDVLVVFFLDFGKIKLIVCIFCFLLYLFWIMDWIVFWKEFLIGSKNKFDMKCFLRLIVFLEFLGVCISVLSLIKFGLVIVFLVCIIFLILLNFGFFIVVFLFILFGVFSNLVIFCNFLFLCE